MNRVETQWSGGSYAVGRVALLGLLVVGITFAGACTEDPPGGNAVPGRNSLGSTPLPCDIQQALRLDCQTCHSAVPLAGVPMALVTWEDFNAPAPSYPAASVAQMIGVRINDATNPMPPAPYHINPVVRDRLNAHLQAGNPANTDPSCGGGGTGGTAGYGGYGGTAGDVGGGSGGFGGYAGDVGGGSGGFGGDAGTSGFGGNGGTGGTPPDLGQCYTFPVHSVSAPGDNTPYRVAGQHYSCFYFDAPWPDTAQGITFKSKFDSRPDIVHHWLVYLDENEPQNIPDGTVVANCSGTHPSNPTLVAGWAAGADNYELPNDVGLKLNTTNKKILIEYHWYLPPGQPAVNSTSAIEICTAATPRPNTATISWLGSEAISLPGNRQTTITGSCTPQDSCTFPGVVAPQTQDIYIVRSWPHMHKYGYRMDSHIIRQNGQRELLFDELFSFDNQISYPTPQVLHPGDRIETRCYYNNTSPGTVTIGYNTEDEMCFNFMTAYPADALKSRNPFGCVSTSLTSTATACLF